MSRSLGTSQPSADAYSLKLYEGARSTQREADQRDGHGRRGVKRGSNPARSPQS